MNSLASVSRASGGRATPKVSPPLVCGAPLARPHVLKMMPVSGSVMVTGTLFWARTDGTTTTPGRSAYDGRAVSGSGTHTTRPRPGRRETERRTSSWETNTVIPRLCRPTRRREGGAEEVPPLLKLVATLLSAKLTKYRRKQMKGVVGGNGGNPGRHCELDVTPAIHPGILW